MTKTARQHTCPEILWAVSRIGTWYQEKTEAWDFAERNSATFAEFIRMDVHRSQLQEELRQINENLDRLRTAARAAADALKERIYQKEANLLELGNSYGKAAQAVEDDRNALECLEELL